MSSNSKLVLFFVLATVFNILLMGILVILFWVIASLVPAPNLRLIILFVGFIASIVLTFLAYGRVMKWVTVRFALEKNIPQLFKNRRK
ncbi:MAG: leader peptide processing enzyme [Spirochaetia bacterium]